MVSCKNIIDFQVRDIGSQNTLVVVWKVSGPYFKVQKYNICTQQQVEGIQFKNFTHVDQDLRSSEIDLIK